jgi:HD-GYP domain-containing protein (c-di-GMP phosphodiesterase class II)
VPNVATIGGQNGRQGTARDRDASAPWIALDRYIRDLERSRSGSDRFSSALSTICDSTNARLAFIYSDGVVGAHENGGAIAAAPQWCRDLTHRLVALLPHGGLWSPDENRGRVDLRIGPTPTAAVILPVDSPKASWMVALSVDPDPPLDEADMRVVTVIWRLHGRHNRKVRLYENLKETLFGVVRCLSTAIDAKDPYTCGHSERVARIAVRIGEEMGLSRGEINDLYLAGLLHDVGKIGIRDEVLFKPGPLNPEEFAHIKEHPVTGERIISNVTRLAYLRPAIRGHHEWFNGQGYPDGLIAEAIPLPARILAVADSCDAMMSPRRYRHAFAQPTIESIFADGSGQQWDPNIVRCFFACRHELYEVCQRGLGQSVYMAVERAAGCGSQVIRASIALQLSSIA